MNIIFEGISGAGKTTIIEELLKGLSDQEVTYIPDLEYETPLTEILLKLVTNNLFMESEVNFKTSIFESLLLAANHHYTQEKLRNNPGITIYDRDFISVLAMQKEIIKLEYDNWEEFYKSFRKIMLFSLKPIDHIVYVETPIEICVQRLEQRDNRNLNLDDIEMLKQINSNMKSECSQLSSKYGFDIINVNGNHDVEKNVNLIKKVLVKR